MVRAKFIHAVRPEHLEEQVQTFLAADWDLYGPLTVSDEGVGQWLVEGKSFYEYRLLMASADALGALVNTYISEGWDFHQGTLNFKGIYLQWMLKDISLDYFHQVEAVVANGIVSA